MGVSHEELEVEGSALCISFAASSSSLESVGRTFVHILVGILIAETRISPM